MKLELSMAEVGAIQAIARGATQPRMTSRIEARLLELGLISRPRHEFAVTAAGRRAGNHSITGYRNHHQSFLEVRHEYRHVDSGRRRPGLGGLYAAGHQ